MDFKLVLSRLLSAFAAQGINYALIGGFALGLRGVPRASVDLDFLILRDDMNKMDVVMSDLGYECRYRTENVSQYVSPLSVFGEVDFLHAFRDTAVQILERAEDMEVFGGAMRIRTARSEDLIGLKLQALVNNPERITLSNAEKELVEAAKSGSLSEDMARLRRNRHNPFLAGGQVPEAYVEFVCMFNEFINHAPKPFKRSAETLMLL